jgi:hypothetical protein
VKTTVNAVLVAVLAILVMRVAGNDTPVPPRPDVVVTDGPPFKADRLSVLIVEQTEDIGRLPKSQAAILQANTTLRVWLQQAGADFRQLDADETGELLDDKWKAAMAVPRQSVPWIVIANQKTGFSGPLPKTVDETIALIEGYR